LEYNNAPKRGIKDFLIEYFDKGLEGFPNFASSMKIAYLNYYMLELYVD